MNENDRTMHYVITEFILKLNVILIVSIINACIASGHIVFLHTYTVWHIDRVQKQYILRSIDILVFNIKLEEKCLGFSIGHLQAGFQAL